MSAEQKCKAKLSYARVDRTVEPGGAIAERIAPFLANYAEFLIGPRFCADPLANPPHSAHEAGCTLRGGPGGGAVRTKLGRAAWRAK